MGIREPVCCAQCGVEFYPPEYGVMYCSYACRSWAGETVRMVEEGWNFFWSKPRRTYLKPTTDSTIHSSVAEVMAAESGNAFAIVASHPPRQGHEG